MTERTDVLDEAFERLAQWGFDDPVGYVNHAPMACEALDTLDRPAEVDSWSRLDSGTPPATPVESRHFAWTEALGNLTLAGEWMGYFQRAVADDGWPAVLSVWLPQLLPGMGTALFHGAIRCAHATRALQTADTSARRAELVRSLGYWAALFTPSYPPDLASVRDVDEPKHAVVGAAADAARYYLARPTIIHLHGVTAAMAVSILIEHTDEAAAPTALAQIKAEHTALYARTEPVLAIDISDISDISDNTLVDAAIASGDAHAVKLVEAARRGFAATGDPVFLAAAERVTRRGRRTLEAREGSTRLG